MELEEGKRRCSPKASSSFHHWRSTTVLDASAPPPRWFHKKPACSSSRGHTQGYSHRPSSFSPTAKEQQPPSPSFFFPKAQTQEKSTGKMFSETHAPAAFSISTWEGGQPPPPVVDTYTSSEVHGKQKKRGPVISTDVEGASSYRPP